MSRIKISIIVILTLFVIWLIMIQVISSMHQGSHEMDRDAYLVAVADYAENCSGCHGLNPREFVSKTWSQPKNFHTIKQAVSEGVRNTDMVSYLEKLGEDRIDQLSTFLISELDSFERRGFFRAEYNWKGLNETEDLNFRLDTIIQSMEIAIPWSFEFLPDGSILIANRSGALLTYRSIDGLHRVEGMPDILSASETIKQAGLMDAVLDPDFASNHLIYLSCSKKGRIGNTTAVLRGELHGNQLSNTKFIFEAKPYRIANGNFGSRLLFTEDGKLLVSVGDRGAIKSVQDLDNHYGSINRINTDGSIPEDNPFVETPNGEPSVYAYGFRNVQGLAINPRTGSIWSSDHGPRGGDELNIVKKGANYGWPLTSYGTEYDGTKLSDHVEMEGIESPLHYWVPSIAPCGIGFVNSARYPGWDGDLLVSSLSFKFISRIKMDGDRIIGEEQLLKNIGRVRDIKMGPDSLIYFSVEGYDGLGTIYRINPADEKPTDPL